jgi:DNA modification methylase
MKPLKKMTDRLYHITEGDVLEEMKKMERDSYDGAFCDPPYGIGMMGKKWDQNVPGVEVWQQMLRVCKPGAYLLAFGSPKTFHRLMCNIEDAGWEIKDTICWLHGEGKSASSDFSKQIRRYSGHARTAQKFRGRGHSLRPLWEPIVLAMKPVHDRYATNAVVFGCAGFNTQNCRLKGKTGRLPSNVILDQQSAQLLDEQSGVSHSRRSVRRKTDQVIGNGRTMNKFVSRYSTVEGYDDKGGVSRYFYVAKAKAKERDGNEHPTVKPVELCEYLARLILPPKRDTPRCLLVPFSGSGSEMIGAINAGWDHVRGIEKDGNYINVARRRLLDK